MIKELKKIIKSEIKKNTKKNQYTKTITTDTSKIKDVAVGKLSY